MESYTQPVGTMTLSPSINGFDEEYESLIFEGPFETFEVPEGYNTCDTSALDVYIELFEGPYRNGSPIPHIPLEEAVQVRFVPSDSSEAVNACNYIVRDCTHEYAYHIRYVLSLLEAHAPDDLLSAIGTLLREGQFDHTKDPGHSGKHFHEMYNAVLKEKPLQRYA